jgi:hypothetical protein
MEKTLESNKLNVPEEDPLPKTTEGLQHVTVGD